MRVIIRCAGDGERWGNYRDVPKHLAPICGEPILNRTVRLCNEIVPDADVKVVVADLKDRRYKVDGSSRTTDKPNPDNGDLDKIASSRHLWDSDRTVVLWGDTWWSRDALTDVLTAEHDDWHAWLRFGPNGHGGELFAFSWPGDRNERVEESLDHAIANQLPGQRGGWMLYRALANKQLDDHADHGNSTIVDDWTEDFDAPDDWDQWCYRWATTDTATRDRMTR